MGGSAAQRVSDIVAGKIHGLTTTVDNNRPDALVTNDIKGGYVFMVHLAT